MSADFLPQVNAAALSNARLYTSRLSDTQIRLLAYEQSSNTWRFETHELAEAPSYAVISYTWGPNEDNPFEDEVVVTKDGVPRHLSVRDRGQYYAHDIDCTYFLIIEGEKYYISRNVHELATRAVRDGIELLSWIDSLCINQADLLERSSQVRMMGDIFRNAQYVLVWLGTDERAEAQTVKELCLSIQAELWRQVDSESGSGRVQQIHNVWDAKVFESMGLPPPRDERWFTLMRFWDRRWFHRAWVIQEAALAASVQMWWGDTDLDFKLLGDVSAFIMQAQLALFAYRGSTGGEYSSSEWFCCRRKIGETVAKIRSFRLLVFPQPEDVDGQPYLMDSYDVQCNAIGGGKMIDGQPRKDCMRYWANMLETNRTFDAADPRDYIYATLGMIDTAATNRGWVPTGIVVDYTKSVAEVYTNAAKRIMEASKCVNLVTLAQDSQMRKQRGLPSWVPDFSARGGMPILLPRSRRWDLMPKLYELAQSLDDPSCSQFSIAEIPRTLGVKAIRLDKVSLVGESHYELTNGGMWEKTAQVLMSRSTFVANESRTESLRRTLVANTSLSGEDVASSDMAKLFKSFVTTSLVARTHRDAKHLEQLPTWLKFTEEECFGNHDATDAPLPSAAYIHETVDFMRRKIKEDAEQGKTTTPGPIASAAGTFGRAMEPMFYRRVLVTNLGYLGFGPMSTMPDDELWLLPGLPLPTVLRPSKKGSQYNLLGEAYLHGDPDYRQGHDCKEWQLIDLI